MKIKALSIHFSQYLNHHKIVGVLVALVIFVLAVFFALPALQSSAQAYTIKISCADSNTSKENCYNKIFRAYAKEHGPADAFATLHALFAIDRDAQGCHFIAHGIGYGTYERDPKNWQQEFRTVSPECSYGAMHGVLEMAVAHNGGLTKTTIPEICGQKPRADCNHIVGHLTLVQTAGSVPKALDLCTVFTDPTQYDHCSSGVFMEEETAVNLVAHDLADKSFLDWPKRMPELAASCRTQTGRNAVMCWKEMAHVFIESAEHDPSAAFSLCATNAPSTDAATECLNHSVGILAASMRFEKSHMYRMCDAFAAFGNIEECRAQAIGAFLSSVPNGTTEAVSYCAGVPKDESPTDCFAMIGNHLVGFTDNEKVRVCSAAPKEFEEICRLGSKSVYRNDTYDDIQK